MLESGELPMQGSPPFDGDVEESHELRYTLNSTTTGSPHTDLVSTPDQPSHDTHVRCGLCHGYGQPLPASKQTFLFLLAWYFLTP